jgi:hypothetical protein
MPNMKTFSRKKVKTHGKRHGKTSMKKYGKTVKTSKARRLRKTKGGEDAVDKTPSIKIPLGIHKDTLLPVYLFIDKIENKDYLDIQTKMNKIIKDSNQDKDITKNIETLISTLDTNKSTCSKYENDCETIKSDRQKGVFSFLKQKTLDEATKCLSASSCNSSKLTIYYYYYKYIEKYIEKYGNDTNKSNTIENLEKLKQKFYENVETQRIKSDNTNTPNYNNDSDEIKIDEFFDNLNEKNPTLFDTN